MRMRSLSKAQHPLFCFCPNLYQRHFQRVSKQAALTSVTGYTRTYLSCLDPPSLKDHLVQYSKYPGSQYTNISPRYLAPMRLLRHLDILKHRYMDKMILRELNAMIGNGFAKAPFIGHLEVNLASLKAFFLGTGRSKSKTGQTLYHHNVIIKTAAYGVSPGELHL